MKFFFTPLTFFLFSVASLAQNIDFLVADPQPNLIEVYGGSFASGDIDGDGDQDLLITGLDPGRETALYLNNGNGVFTEVMDIPFPEASSSVTIFEDLDTDGDLDLFFSGNGFNVGEFTHIYLNNGLGEFSQLANPALPQFQDSGVGIEDVDNDGDPDILISVLDVNGNFVADVFINDGNANFAAAGSTTITPVKFGSVAFIDADNDSDADVVISGTQENESALTTIYLNDGLGNYSIDANADFVQLSADDVDVTDFDNDGDVDILMSGATDLFEIRTILYSNNGQGQFTELSTNLQQTFAGTNAIADLDNDGDQDIVILGSQDGGLPNIYNIVYENLGDNEFLPIDTLGGEYIADCVIKDFNGDGLPDIIIQGFVDKTNVYWNTSITTSFDELTKPHLRTIYPNPSNGAFHINSNNDEPFSIKIFNSNGVLIYQNQISGRIAQVQLNLPDGIYSAVITAKNITQTHKLVISK